MSYLYDTYTTPGQGKLILSKINGFRAQNYWKLTFQTVSELPISKDAVKHYDDVIPAYSVDELKAIMQSISGVECNQNTASEIAESIIDILYDKNA
jgi:hypothetical protein